MPSVIPEGLGPGAKRVLRIVFLTLFIDLVGFSLIFPLFPAMLAYYTANDPESGLLRLCESLIQRFEAMAGLGPGASTIVLFGGLLGSLYSLLQFVCAPLIGALSDRYGRRPVMLASMAGIAVSYALWFFADRFALLVLARLIGGIMSGNISTATAAVADVTTPRNRPRGMAIVGVAFALGFIIGPALGGFSTAIDITKTWPALTAYGVNPFSVPAGIAFALAITNLLSVALRFPETLLPAARRHTQTARTANPFRLFHAGQYPGVNAANLAYFIFLSSFSGMEFSLTFLAFDRFGYGPRQNAYMLLFVGFMLAATQGSYVRRYADRVGLRRMARHGLLLTMPGLILAGWAQSVPWLYAGLLFMSIGSAQVIPCMTSLVSAYAPPAEQGRILGVFRSLGALARATGPAVACVLYWRLGSGVAYYLGAGVLLVPAALVSLLPGRGAEDTPGAV